MRGTLASGLNSSLQAAGSSPVVVWYGPEGRIEIGGGNFRRWVAKCSNALVEQADVSPGSTVSVAFPAHFLGPVLACAVWSVGAELSAPGTSADVWLGHEAPDAGSFDTVCGVATSPLARSMPPTNTPWWDVDLVEATVSSADEPLYHADSLPWANLPALDCLADSGSRAAVAAPPAEAWEGFAAAGFTIASGGHMVIVSDPSSDIHAVAEAEKCDCVILK